MLLLRENSKTDIERAAEVLKKLRIHPLDIEYRLQQMISDALVFDNIDFQKEYKLGLRSRVDFLLDGGIIIETKKGRPYPPVTILQLQKYASFSEVSGIILLTEKYIDIPKEINGKPCVCIGLTHLWGIAL